MPKSFADVVKDGRFGYVSQQFGPKYASFWDPGLGDKVRGDLVLLTMGSPLYRETEVRRRMARVDVRLQPATAYELAVYAVLPTPTGWNGRRRVMALGSKHTRGAVPVIQPSTDQKTAMMIVDVTENGYWENDRSILCVRT